MWCYSERLLTGWRKELKATSYSSPEGMTSPAHGDEYGDSINQYRLGIVFLESSFAEEVLVDKNLNISQQCALTAKVTSTILGCIRIILSRSSDLMRSF